MTNEDEEFRGRMSVEVEHIYERLADIETQLIELRSLMVARLDAHDRYHEQNEHRWGAIQWCHRHPFRMLSLAASLAVALIGELRDPLLRWMFDLIRKTAG
jgi:hypothetical protein